MPKGKKNRYTCQTCHKTIVTIDVDEGTTPFMLLCKATPGCKGFMHSHFYNCDPNLTAQYEFFKPASFEGYDAGMLEHLQKGGLDFRPVGGESEWQKPRHLRRRRRYHPKNHPRRLQ